MFLLIVIPWVLVAVSYFLEGSIGRFPGPVVDVLVPARLHHASSVAALFSVILISLEVIVILKALQIWLMERPIGPTIRHIISPRPGVLLIVIAGLVLLLGVKAPALGNYRIYFAKDYLTVARESPDFFIRGRHGLPEHPVVVKADLSCQDDREQVCPRNHIGRSDLVELCQWIQVNTSQSAAFFTPPYMTGFRTFCHRQTFFSEKVDGDYAVVNRKFATIYMARFSDLLAPLSYDTLPGPVFAPGTRAYELIRAKYLSLTSQGIEELKLKYPEYRYWLTESEQQLPYRVAYTDEFFTIYDLS